MIETELESHRQAAALAKFAGNGIYGLEWGDPRKPGGRHAEVVRRFIQPFAHGNILEIGAGGGRWSRELLPFADGKLILVDANKESEKLIRRTFEADGIPQESLDRVKFLISPDGELSTLAAGSIDYAFSFDTFVHFHPRLFHAYLREVANVLKSGGKFAIHFALLPPDGESPYDPICFQYRTWPEFVAAIDTAGLSVAGLSVAGDSTASTAMPCWLDFGSPGFGSRCILLERL